MKDLVSFLKVRVTFFVLISLFSCLSVLFFPEYGKAQELKIGYVDLRLALNESEAGKKAKTELESMIKIKQAAIDEKGKAIDKLKRDLEKQASVLSEEARKSKEEEIERHIREYQRLVQDSQAEVKKKESELTGSILKELREIIDKIGKEENYTLILENVEGLILYSKKDIDLTEKVIKVYNETKAKKK
ncbi:MAG: OmpH family outer membrane protein [Thermodesulfovibrionales bacterium]